MKHSFGWNILNMLLTFCIYARECSEVLFTISDIELNVLIRAPIDSALNLGDLVSELSVWPTKIKSRSAVRIFILIFIVLSYITLILTKFLMMSTMMLTSIRSGCTTSVWQFDWRTEESLNRTSILEKHIASKILMMITIMVMQQVVRMVCCSPWVYGSKTCLISPSCVMLAKCQMIQSYPKVPTLLNFYQCFLKKILLNFQRFYSKK